MDFFILAPPNPITLDDLLSALKIDKETAQVHLNYLFEVGILEKLETNQMISYRLCDASPRVNDLKDLFKVWRET